MRALTINDGNTNTIETNKTLIILKLNRQVTVNGDGTGKTSTDDRKERKEDLDERDNGEHLITLIAIPTGTFQKCWTIHWQ